MMNVLRFFIALGLFVLSVIVLALYFLGPAIFVACFRFQYSKWKRILAVLKTVGIMVIIYIACVGVMKLGTPKLLAPWPGAFNGLILFYDASLVFISGILTSRFLPALDQPPLGPRPLTVRLFEYLFIFQIGLGLLNSILGYDFMAADYEEMVQNNDVSAALTAPAYVLIKGSICKLYAWSCHCLREASAARWFWVQYDHMEPP